MKSIKLLHNNVFGPTTVFKLHDKIGKSTLIFKGWFHSEEPNDNRKGQLPDPSIVPYKRRKIKKIAVIRLSKFLCYLVELTH